MSQIVEETALDRLLRIHLQMAHKRYRIEGLGTEEQCFTLVRNDIIRLMQRDECVEAFNKYRGKASVIRRFPKKDRYMRMTGILSPYHEMAAGDMRWVLIWENQLVLPNRMEMLELQPEDKVIPHDKYDYDALMKNTMPIVGIGETPRR